MGGEKWPILVYGPKEIKRIEDWMIQLKIVNDDVFDDEPVDSEYEAYTYKLEDFLEKNGLVMVYFDNFNWKDSSIGFEVDEYDKITVKEKQKVEMFCKKYNLNNPTFYAGIVGEYE